ncbi:MAG: GYD domain-containing protein [Deltaproteobacteria bacterium]|jgi:uncharacterized protein with GYD domain
MKYFLILSNLTDEGKKTVKQFPHRVEVVNKAMRSLGTKIVAQYALLGPYDFITIVEAENEKVVLKAAMELGSRGTVKTITLPAIPIDEFVREFSDFD